MPTASLGVPEGLKQGPKLDLEIYRPKTETGSDEETGPGGPAQFNAEMVIKQYWGSSETVRPGQPIVTEFKGLSDEQILSRHPGLTRTDLEAAWEYYRSNPGEIDRALWENEAAMVDPVGGNVPVTFLLRGRELGLSDAEIRDAFEPPLGQDVLDKAWAQAANRSKALGA